MATRQSEAEDYARRRAQYDREQQAAHQAQLEQAAGNYPPQVAPIQEAAKEYPREQDGPTFTEPYAPPSAVAYEPELHVHPGPSPLPSLVPSPTMAGVPPHEPQSVAETPSTPDLAPFPQVPSIEPMIPHVSPTIVPSIGLGGAPIYCMDFSLDLSGTTLLGPFRTPPIPTLGPGSLTSLMTIYDETPPPTYVQDCKLTIFPFDCERIPCIDDASENSGAVRSRPNPADKKQLIYTTEDKIEIMYKVEGKGRNGKMVVIPLLSGPRISTIAFGMDIPSDEGKHCIKWPLVVAPAKLGDPLATASPGRYLIVLSCESDEGRCEDRISVTVHDVDHFLRIYKYWIDYFDETRWGTEGVKGRDLVIGEVRASYEHPFIYVLDIFSKTVADKYYSSFLKGSEGAREFKDPSWALTVSTWMAHFFDAGLRQRSGEWRKWRNDVADFNDRLANADKREAIWGLVSREWNAKVCLETAMEAEQVHGLAFALFNAGPNKCCEEEFKAWARTFKEVSNKNRTARRMYQALGQVFGILPADIEEIPRRYYARAKEKARAWGWTCY